jgi:hypothetical protein
VATSKPSGVAPAATPEPVEELPFHAAVPRLAVPDAVLGHPGFPDIVLTADAEGVVRPQTPDEVRLADALQLPVIRKE